MTVLDASALLAFLFREPGADKVASVLTGSCISAINLSEVAVRFMRDGHDPIQVQQRLSLLPLEVVPFERVSAYETARLIQSTGSLGLSLGDRACLSLALARDLTAWTADQAWQHVTGIKVFVIR